jgi:hypothetical protein
MKKPRLGDVEAALTEGILGAIVAVDAVLALAYVAPGLIGSPRAAMSAVVLAGSGVFVSRLRRNGGSSGSRQRRVGG